MYLKLEPQIILHDYETDAIKAACEEMPPDISRIFPGADKFLLQQAIVELTESVVRSVIVADNGHEALENIEPAMRSPNSRILNIMLASRDLDVEIVVGKLKPSMNSILGKVGELLSRQTEENVLEEFDVNEFLESHEWQSEVLLDYLWVRIPGNQEQRALAELWLSLDTRDRQLIVDDPSGHRLAYLIQSLTDVDTPDIYGLSKSFMETLEAAGVASDYRIAPVISR